MFDDKDKLISFMIDHGADKILFKCLAENDNSKQQIYLGGSFEALNQIPFGEVVPDNIYGKVPNYKASLNFYWISDEGQVEKAPGAKLILYPKYPEVRLSGFLQGCSIAPSEYLQPVSAGKRKSNNTKDGRVLVLGIHRNGRIFAYLIPAGTPLANQFFSIADNEQIFTRIDLVSSHATKTELLSKIRSIQKRGWIPGCRINSEGLLVDYKAINGGGYTLEACFGIIPNGRAEPDWKGWEVKSYTGNRITLMTPEPDAGYYNEHKVGAFVAEYGHVSEKGEIYFTGVHKWGRINKKTGMKIVIDGYDEVTNRIVKVNGGLTLLDSKGNPAAVWTFAKLIEHWGKKHARAVYIPYLRNTINMGYEYKYINPVILGEGTDFDKFLQAFKNGFIDYDPGSKLFINDKGNYQTKARNQFRIKTADLKTLYHHYSVEILN